MGDKSWVQASIDCFFEARASPTQAECDEMARSLSTATNVRTVDVPGSLSYTVIGTNRRDQGQDLIISFRELGSTIDLPTVELARSIHGCLVPDATYHGQMPGAHPSLHIYTMPYLQGIPSLKALWTKSELTPEAEASHTCYVEHLARYFARCWLTPQRVDPNQLEQRRTEIHRRLVKLRNASPPIMASRIINELETSVPVLFSNDYPQVLTHNDLSRANILVHEKTLEITGIVDWSLATPLPFGMELFALSLMTGYMGVDGWHDYNCREKLHIAFWEEFSSICGICDDHMRRNEVYDAAQRAAKLGGVLHYAFQRNADGSPSEELATSQGLLMFLPVLLAEFS